MPRFEDSRLNHNQGNLNPRANTQNQIDRRIALPVNVPPDFMPRFEDSRLNHNQGNLNPQG